MNSRILEIGSGNAPAVLYPGAVLADPTADYYAIDASARQIKEGFRHRPALEAAYAGSIMVGDSAKLPFDNQSFSSVIMRSVFGEYTMGEQHTGSNRQNTGLGLYEAFRVLQDNGEIAIAEENTPYSLATPTGLGHSLLSIGFKDITIYPCQDMHNPHWLEQRTRFWGLEPARGGSDPNYQLGQPIDQRRGFLVRANRPQAETVTLDVTVRLPGAWQTDLVNSPAQTATPVSHETRTFIKSSQGLEYDAADPNAWQSEVQIVTKDGQFTLQDYPELVRAKSVPILFMEL